MSCNEVTFVYTQFTRNIAFNTIKLEVKKNSTPIVLHFQRLITLTLFWRPPSYKSSLLIKYRNNLGTEGLWGLWLGPKQVNNQCLSTFKTFQLWTKCFSFNFLFPRQIYFNVVVADTKALATSATTHIFSSCKLTIPTSIIFLQIYVIFSILSVKWIVQIKNWIEISSEVSCNWYQLFLQTQVT